MYRLGDYVEIKGKYEADWKHTNPMIVGIRYHKQYDNSPDLLRVDYTVWEKGDGYTDGWSEEDFLPSVKKEQTNDR